MYQTILVPLDGSDRAEAILPHVVDLAKQAGATVILLQVVEPFYDAVTPDGSLPVLDARLITEREISGAQDYLSAVRARLEKLGVKAEMRVQVSGAVVSTILDVAKEERADLIAMASHGRSGLARVFYGSVAVGVLHSVDRPLLLVRSLGAD